ncbi:MAG: hypothetical protein J1F16_06955 [Muribaculaceae bacterium]|nr:hypothetical protein [Muribaculaceae bacterium]
MKWLTFATFMGLSFIFCSCSTDDPNVDASNFSSAENILLKNSDGNESLCLPNGEMIVLEDTITYIIQFDTNNLSYFSCEDEIKTRGILYTGYDRESIPKDYTKYILKGLDKWGIDPNTVYIGKFINYYKNLPVSKGYSLLPSNTKYATENSMGFNPPSLTVGFHTTIPETWNGYETGVTQILYVYCDASGISWNKNIPCNPDQFIWYFRAIPDE